MSKSHNYQIHLNWTGNKGKGTLTYRDYERDYDLRAGDKPVIEGSSDPVFRGDPSRHNPEEMLLMSLSSCHMLWYLHLCSVNKIVVEKYTDKAEGVMNENPDGSGEFKEVTLRPEVTISAGDIELAESLHHKASEMCFIARSMNFAVRHKATLITQQ